MEEWDEPIIIASDRFFYSLFFQIMDDRYITTGWEGSMNFTASASTAPAREKVKLPYGMSMTAYKSMRRANGTQKSSLFTKKWTKGRRNQLNVYLFMKTRIDNKHKYA